MILSLSSFANTQMETCSVQDIPSSRRILYEGWQILLFIRLSDIVWYKVLWMWSLCGGRSCHRSWKYLPSKVFPLCQMQVNLSFFSSFPLIFSFSSLSLSLVPEFCLSKISIQKHQSINLSESISQIESHIG